MANSIGWGKVNTSIGWGETASEFVRVTEIGDVRFTESLENRVTEGVDASGWGEYYNQSWTGETELEA
jgi:hypothetical protein